jgi:hypothetical protein
MNNPEELQKDVAHAVVGHPAGMWSHDMGCLVKRSTLRPEVVPSACHAIS